MTHYRFLIATLGLAFASVVSSVGADWPQWRGPADLGSVDSGNYPSELNDQTLRWKTPLPGKGCSTPIVVDQTIYVTAPADGNDALLAIDWQGNEKWRTTFGPEVSGKHRNGSGSNASPVCDGEAVYVYFKSGTLAAVELDGSVRWQTNLVDRFGKDTLYWDHGTSPVLTKQHVVFARMHNGESWLAAFDKKSGQIAWKVARNYETPRECDHGYTTPLVIDYRGRESLLLWGAQHLTIHDATDGGVIWSCGNFNPDSTQLWPAIATPVIVDDVAVIAYGRNDKGAPRLHGVRMDGSGDVTATNHVWFRDDMSTFVPTPAVHQGRVYLVRDRGEVECINPATGESIWSDAFPRNRNAYYASPTIAGGKLYAPREDGVVFVASVTDGKFQLLSENDLQESVIGSPVPIDDRLFLRGERHLFCFQNSVAVSSWQADPVLVEKLTQQRPEFNYVEAKVPSYTIPDPLVTMAGNTVDTPADWSGVRRGELLELFRDQVYGRRPETRYSVRFEQTAENTTAFDGAATGRAFDAIIKIDDRSYSFPFVVFVPNGITGKVPAVVHINNRYFVPLETALEKNDPFWPVETMIRRGYATASFHTSDVDPDKKDGYEGGIRSFFADGKPPTDNAWRSLSAWGWAASRVLDYLETVDAVDASRVAVSGHSRGGKTSLWAACEDERFAIAYSNNSGCGGAALSRRAYGETVGRITTSFPHWFCKPFAAYAGCENELPVDQHEVIALIAPRGVYVASADQDLWADPKGEYTSLVAAAPVFQLLGKQSIETASMPSLGQQRVVGQTGYHIRAGGHGLGDEDWGFFLDFADTLLK